MLEEIHSSSKDALDAFAAEGLSYDLTAESRDALSSISPPVACSMLSPMPTTAFSEGGFDCRNYGILDGLPETKRLFLRSSRYPATRDTRRRKFLTKYDV